MCLALSTLETAHTAAAPARRTKTERNRILYTKIVLIAVNFLMEIVIHFSLLLLYILFHSETASSNDKKCRIGLDSVLDLNAFD